MHVFDLDAFVEALEPPAVKVGGRVYEGKRVGFLDSQGLLRDFQHLEAKKKEGTLEADEYIKFLRKTCELLGMPVDVILNQPAPAVVKIMRDFLQYLAQQSKQHLTNGSSSPSSGSVGPRDEHAAAESRLG